MPFLSNSSFSQMSATEQQRPSIPLGLIRGKEVVNCGEGEEKEILRPQTSYNLKHILIEKYGLGTFRRDSESIDIRWEKG